MAIKRSFTTILWVLFSIILATCTPLQESNVLLEPLSLPPDYYGSVLRFPNGEIFIQTGRFEPYINNNLYYYDLAKNQFVDVFIENDPYCRSTRFGFPTALPDGRLGLNKMCLGYWPNRPIGQDEARFIIAYDWSNRSIEQIVREPLSPESSSFSWNPEMTRGVQEIGSLLGTITWLTSTGTEPMIVTIGTGEQSWTLDESLRVMEDYQLGLNRTDEVGIAERPVWSRDGKQIVFWASTDVIGLSGMARARGTYSLYLLNPNTLEVEPVLSGVRNVGDIVWSPDNQWLLFVGEINSQEGLWLIRVEGKQLSLVDLATGYELFSDFQGFNWLNEQEVIATKCTNSDCNETAVIKYDVSEIVTAALSE